jgi:fatty-acyl-CoA synthase
MYDLLLTQSFFPAIADAPVERVTIGDMLRREALGHPDTIALKELGYDSGIGRTWTYQRLLADAERLGRTLARRHAPGARIAVYANNLPEWVLLELGAAMAGLILVTVNPAYQKRELAYVLGQSRAEAIYHVEEFRGNPMRSIADAACEDLPAIRHRILMTDEAAFFGADEGAALPDVSPEDPAQIQYTSGTTGFPKGALLHHHGLVQNARDVMLRFGFAAGETFMHNMPMFHTTGCAIVTLGTLGLGGGMLLAPAFDPVMIARVIERERPGFLLGVPTMLVALIDEAARSGRDLSSIRRVMSGGALVAPDLVRKAEAAFGSKVQIVYGQTECSPGITMAWHDDSLADMTQTIGQPLPNMDVAILDPQTAAVLPIGEQGEICTRGYHVMTGYNDDPAASAKAIDAHGWLHSGDLGRMDSRGYLTITGRVKEMIIRGGENLFPAEIETAMLEHDEISEVAVVGIPCPVFGEQVACFMRPSGAGRPPPAELKAFVRERLSPQKTPYFWIWVDRWPLTGSGKIQKFVLAEQFGRGEHQALEA